MSAEQDGRPLPVDTFRALAQTIEQVVNDDATLKAKLLPGLVELRRLIESLDAADFLARRALWVVDDNDPDDEPEIANASSMMFLQGAQFGMSVNVDDADGTVDAYPVVALTGRLGGRGPQVRCVFAASPDPLARIGATLAGHAVGQLYLTGAKDAAQDLAQVTNRLFNDTALTVIAGADQQGDTE